MSQVAVSVSMRCTSVARPSRVTAAVRWAVAVGLLVGLVLSAIVSPAGRESQLGSTGELGATGAEPAWQPPATTLESPLGSLLQPAPAPSTALPDDARRRLEDAYGKLPLAFVPNAGQTDRSVRYYAQGAGFSFYFTKGEAVLSFQRGDRGQVLNLRFVGANPNARLAGADRGTGTVNYLTGSEHHTNLPTYHQLVYRELWPGIDMAFSGVGGSLKYEFRLRPGADPGDIRLAYAGAEGLALGAGGALLVDTPLGSLRDARPQSFQRIDGRRVPVDSHYALAGNSYGFAVGSYDRGRPLVIDPSLAYSTYLGGSGDEQGFGIAVDSAGAAYVTGRTTSTTFPTTAGAFDTSASGSSDAFITKLNASGSSLAYSTYLGGSGFDGGFGIAVDSQGAAYVAGQTGSTDFPTTAGAFDTSANANADAFVAKLDPTGSSLAYSTYLGGSGTEAGFGIAVDSLGAAYVAGTTNSPNFPTTVGAFDTSGTAEDAFVTKLNPLGSGLAYSTYLGGSSDDGGRGIAIDSAGAAYVTGRTGSTNFPTTAGAFDTTFNGGGGDVFVTKLNPLGSSLAYSTYLGGSSFEGGGLAGVGEIAVDSAGAAYVTGETFSTDFPTTAGAFDTTFNGVDDVYVTKLDPTGSSLAYSTYLGGSSVDTGNGIAVDPQGTAYVTGRTASTNFPTTTGAFDTSWNGGFDDAFVTKLNPAGSSLDYSTYLGGSTRSDEFGLGIAVDSQGAGYVTGVTGSADFPTTAGAFDTSFNGGGGDAFVTKLTFAPGGEPATLTLSPKAATNDVDTEHCVTATVRDASGSPVPDVTVRFSVTGSVNTSGSDATDANGEATFCYQGPELPGTDAISAFADTDDDGTQDPGEPSDTASKVWTLPSSTPLCEARVTEGGRITANNGDTATLGGSAQSDGQGTVKGQEEYQDHGPADPQTVNSIQLLALTCNPERTQATIFGTATIDGSGTHLFRIDVQDLGEPGVGMDTYRILLDTGYDSGVQTLEGGNVQVHEG